jgi:alkylation response protein AidB-like acyl-CoA dehydrogenase
MHCAHTLYTHALPYTLTHTHPHPQGLSIMANAMAAVEFARVDASLATFSLVHNFLALITIGLLGSEEQKKTYLPAMAKYEQVGLFGFEEGRRLKATAERGVSRRRGRRRLRAESSTTQ